MRTLRLLVFVLLLQASSHGSETAYRALRVIGAQRGQVFLDRVLEVEGRRGVPQPSVWRIRVEDSTARGGIREFEVSNGRIISERTPVRMAIDSPDSGRMDFRQLNLDSEGAFAVADSESRRARVGFDSVDYLLRRDPSKNRPLWELRLADESGRQVARLTIAADNGNILREEGLYLSSAPQRPSRYDDPEPARDEGRDGNDQDDGQGVTLPKIVNKVERKLRRIGGHLENFFTGRRTIDEGYR